MEDLESLDRWPRAKALEIARSEMERLLPEGLATPNHILLEILENNKGPTIGFIWLSLGSKGSEQVAFVHQLLILPEHRRHGHARATLKTIEAALAAKGVAAIVLHVFNNNKAAQQFYSAVGYEVASLNLQKKLNQSND